MATITVKTIEIFGWLSEREEGRGKTAIWTGSKIEETCEVNGPYWTDEEIDAELEAAQIAADQMVAQNGWLISPVARICPFEIEIDD